MLATSGERRWLRGPLAARAHDVVVVDADRHRLRVAKTEGGRMAPGTGVVIMQAEDFVEEQEASEIG